MSNQVHPRLSSYARVERISDGARGVFSHRVNKDLVRVRWDHEPASSVPAYVLRRILPEDEQRR